MRLEQFTAIILIFSILLLLYWIIKRRAELKAFPLKFIDNAIPLRDRVSVIIPVRDEEGSLEECLDSIISQRGVEIEVIVVDDGSMDKSFETAKKYERLGKLKVVKAGDPPRGWLGKSWACYLGYLRSSGDFLLFMDADTKLLSDRVILYAVKALKERGVDYMTLFPRFSDGSPLAAITNSFCSNLFYVLDPPSSLNDPGSRKSFLIGCFALIRREAYESVEGHKLVRSSFAEDKDLGEKLRVMSYRFLMLDGSRAVSTKLAKSVRGMWRNLVKLILIRVDGKVAISAMASAFFFIQFILPLIIAPLSIIIGRLDLLILSSLNIVLAAILEGAELRRNDHSAIYSIFYPIAALIMVACLLYTSVKAKLGFRIEWKRRAYMVKASRISVCSP